MLNTNTILQNLLTHQVDFVLVGGMAAVMYGVSTVTYDVDICFNFVPENIQRLLTALEGIHPKTRTQEKWQELSELSVDQLVRANNLYLQTDCGGLDLLGSLREIGSYQKVNELSEKVEVFGMPCKILNMNSLIEIKKSIGRPKDIQVVLELEAIKENIK